MPSGFKSYLSPELGEFVSAQEGDGAIRKIKELMSDLVTPEFTLACLAEGSPYSFHPGSPKDGHSSCAKGSHWGDDNRVFGPSVNHKRH